MNNFIVLAKCFNWYTYFYCFPVCDKTHKVWTLRFLWAYSIRDDEVKHLFCNFCACSWTHCRFLHYTCVRRSIFCTETSSSVIKRINTTSNKAWQFSELKSNHNQKWSKTSLTHVAKDEKLKCMKKCPPIWFRVLIELLWKSEK